MILHALEMIEPMLAAPDSDAAGRALFAGLADSGVTYLQTRVYERPLAPLTPATHWHAGGFVTRIARDGWVGSDEFRYVCLGCNPLVGAIRQGLTSYRFSDFAPHSASRYGTYWEAFERAGFRDAICATSYGTGRRIASVHIGVADLALDPEWVRSVRVAGLALTERLLDLAGPAQAESSPVSSLTPRERDALSFVALGKTDWEIAQILGVSEATARFHVDNARRKLDAVNRAQAVARFLAQEGPF